MRSLEEVQAHMHSTLFHFRCEVEDIAHHVAFPTKRDMAVNNRIANIAHGLLAEALMKELLILEMECNESEKYN